MCYTKLKLKEGEEYVIFIKYNRQLTQNFF